METTHFPETSVNPIRSLWYKIPEYGILLESQTCEPESRILTLGFESSFAELRKPPVSFMSVGPSSTWNNSDSTGRNLINFDIEGFFQICRESCCFFLNLSRITGTLHQYIYTFINVVELCLEWGMVQKSRKKIKTNFVIKKLKKKSFRLLYNAETYGRSGQAVDGSTIRCMRCACWLPKATDTHSEYVILITYLWRQWLHEITCYVMVKCLSYF